MEVEKDSTAAEERFDVALEDDRIESAQGWEAVGVCRLPISAGDVRQGWQTRALARCSLSARIAQPILVVVMSAPLVSVLLTAFNRTDYLAASIESVLAQTWATSS